MFRKAPLKTYQRKKAGGASTTINRSLIVREDVSANKDLQPKEFLAFKDTDTSLEYDPFDTTFDRIARDVIVPPVLPNVDDDSYSSSSNASSDNLLGDSRSEPLPDPLPIINPRPVPLRRNSKEPKVDKDASMVKIEPKTKAGRKKYRTNGNFDENTEPNFQQKSEKRRRMKKDSKESKNVVQNKKRRVVEKPVVSTQRKEEDKNLDRFKGFKHCSVNLTRVDISLSKSTADSNLANISNGEKTAAKVVVSDHNKDENAKDPSISLGEEENTSTFKNPMVSLTRLNVPHPDASVANKYWLNSTPMTTKTMRTKKYSLHISPITSRKSMEKSHRNEDDSYKSQNLPPEKQNIQSRNLTPRKSKTSRFSNRIKRNEKNLIKTKPLLSDSPDPEPSGLMFDDTEIISGPPDSHAPPKESGTKNAIEASSMTPFLGFSKGPSEFLVADLRPSFDAVLRPIINYNNTMESTTSPFKGFKRDSTNSGSLDESDNVEKSPKKLAIPLEKRKSSMRSPKIRLSRLKISTTPQNRLKEGAELTQSCSEKIAEVSQGSLDESVKDGQGSLSGSQTNRQSILDLSAYDTKNISKEIAKDWESSLDEGSQDAAEQINSDGEWETTTESSTSNLSSLRSSESTGEQRTDGKSIMQVSSDEGNTSTDGSVEFVNVNLSFDQIENDSHRRELSSFKVDESSEVKIAYTQKLLKNIHRNSLQPVVLLSQCSVPISASKRISYNKDNDSVKSIEDLSGENEDDDVEKSINQSPSSVSIEGVNENEESQAEITGLTLDEFSENRTKIEEPASTEISDGDSSNGGFRSPMTKLENTSRSSPKNIEDVSIRKSLVEENPVKILPTDILENNRAPPIQPIVLLNRLNDPIRVGDRRKKYRNWGLSAISEDLAGKNVTTIDEEPEDFETAEIKKDETHKDEIEKEPKMKLSASKETVISQETTVSCDASVLSNQSSASIREDKIVFLKPGKSWSRSLSLFRQVHSQDDVESLAIGKGKKWRQSVQAVLDMQQQGVIQSCVRKNADDKESRSSYGVRNSAAAWIPGSSQPNTSGVLSQTSVGSPGRFIRRISIRVVPDRKNSELYEDSPFLEAYGITSFENRKTIGKRSTLIAPRKTLVYNVNCADVSFENIPKTLNSVTSRDVVLAQCGQDASVPFEEFYPDSYLKYCRKIGEGVFGEVFLYEKGTVRTVIKIIPIEGERKVNGERQKKFDEILSEIVIAKELNDLRFAETCKTSSFVEVKNIRCVFGNYPPMLIDLWNTFDNEKNSENDCPDMFDKSQLYIVLELGHGGQDLEAFVFQNSSEAHALFIQTALALAVAEEALEFEHRDLHWGNILISRTEDSQISYKLRDKDIKVASKGVKVSVIDFTLSRMSYQGCSIFNDLSLDDDLFAAQGEYQFEIYRLMRQKVENNWQTFEPFTNILWLHYTLDKMITAVRYRRTSSKIHKSGIDKLKVLKDEILGYKSAYDFVTNCENVTRLQGSRSNVSTVS